MSAQRTKLGNPQMDWAWMPSRESRTERAEHIQHHTDRMTAAGTMDAAPTATDRQSSREPNSLKKTVARNKGMPSATRKMKSGAAAARNCLPSEVAAADITARNCDTVIPASMVKWRGASGELRVES